MGRNFLIRYIVVFYDDGQGGKHGGSFYDIFPELKTEKTSFAMESCSRKSADFTVVALASFAYMKFLRANTKIQVRDVLVRSVESCRLDLRFGEPSFGKILRDLTSRIMRNRTLRDISVNSSHIFFKEKTNTIQ